MIKIKTHVGNKTQTKTRNFIRGNFHKDFEYDTCFNVSTWHFYARHNYLNVLREHTLMRLLFFFRNMAIRLGKVLAFSGNPIHSKKKSLLGLNQEINYAESFVIHPYPDEASCPPTVQQDSKFIKTKQNQNNKPKHFGYMFCFEQTSILLDRWGLSSFIGVR